MSRFLILLAPLLLASCEPLATMGSRTYMGFSIGIESAPPPPRVVFVESPRTEIVSGTNVYVVDNSDYDMFQCGGYWYVASAGYWYRASNYSGPFAVVDVRSVPRAVLSVPSNHWRHDNGRHRGRDRDRDRDRGNWRSSN